MAAAGLHRGSYPARSRQTGYPPITNMLFCEKDDAAKVAPTKKNERSEYVSLGLKKFAKLVDFLVFRGVSPPVVWGIGRLLNG